jgi:hypothetical protein
MARAATDAITVTCLEKGNEKYIVLLDSAADPVELFRALGRQAANPDLSFTWGDMRKVIEELRKELA